MSIAKYSQDFVNPDEVAVIGMAGRFPGAKSVDEFWENLKNGVESISNFSEKELLAAGLPSELIKRPDYVRAKGILEDIDGFDADFFGYPPREAERMDPQIRLLHEVAWEALESAGYNPEAFSGLIGAYFGANENQEWLRRMQHAQANSSNGFDGFLLNYRDYVATRVSNKLDLKGPSFTLLTACSTSLVAVHLACQSLLQGECNMALAGGVSISLPQKSGYVYHDGLMVSEDGHCRTFDAKASGTVFGDGVGVVVLKPVKTAMRDGDPVLAVIKGSAINNDGNGKAGFTAPSVKGQTTVIRSAHRSAGVSPESIGYIEAHGTATRLGDPIEIEALKKAFDTKKKQFCALGSVKTNIGHVNIAAGIAALIKTVQMLRYDIIPATLHFKKPNPEGRLDESPFFVNTKSIHWDVNGAPRRAGVSAFGFGGTNAHIVIEEAPASETTGKSRSYQIMTLSAKTQDALKLQKKNLAHFLNTHPEVSIPDAAYTLNVGRKHFSHRQAIVCRDQERAMQSLKAKTLQSNRSKFHTKAIFLFPGQGSQYVGMGHDLYREEPVFRETVNLCADLLKEEFNIDILHLLYRCDTASAEAAERLTDTHIAQPALFTLSNALARLWMSWGVTPIAMAGHSVGEFVSAALAGVFSMEDSLRLVAERGRLMQSLPRGSMIIVPLPEDELCERLPGDLSLAAVNSPGLCVVSGETEAIQAFQEKLESDGIECHLLRTSHAFHSPMMDPILEKFEAMVRDVQRNNPKCDVVSTVTGHWIDSETLSDPKYWVKNLRQPVRFNEAIQTLLDLDAHVIEVGPGRTLTSLTQMQGVRAGERVVATSLRHPNETVSDSEFLLNSVGQLWENGLDIDWTVYYKDEKRHRIALPTYPFQRQRFWIDANPEGQPSTVRWDQLHKIQDLSNWFHIPSWRRSALPELNPIGLKKKQSWIVFCEDDAVGDSVVQLLRQNRQDTWTVRPGHNFGKLNKQEYSVRPGYSDDYENLLQIISEKRKRKLNILHLWSTSTAIDDVDQAQQKGFFSLLSLAQVMGKLNMTDPVSLTVVSTNLHEVIGGERICPEKATVLGLVKVIPQEYPNVSCINIDLDEDTVSHGSNLSKQILAEMIGIGGDPIIAYRRGYRWVQIFEPHPLPEIKPVNSRLKKKGVYLITGGSGGIGLALAEYLGRRLKAKLILTGRSSIPERGQWKSYLRKHDPSDPVCDKIRAFLKIEATGGKVNYIRADVADEPTMFKAIMEVINRTGPINGVIHAAGLPGEGIIQLKSHEAAAKILTPKVQGTAVLNNILKDQDLDFFMLCSSIASVLGGIGLSDYCAANAYLDAFAHAYNRKNPNRAVSVNWDMWGDVGMGLKTKMPDELQGWLEKELRDGLTTSEGIDVFERILAHGQAANLVVSTRDLQARIALWIHREFIKEKERLLEENAAKPKYLRPNLTTEFSAPETESEKHVAEVWSRLFGIDKVGRNDNFYELGGHSLLATTMVNMLKKEIDANVSIRDVLDHPTVAELGMKIDNG